jgi:hypothetical protein
VWICPDPNGHLQAVGRDARGRKRYRYYGSWRADRHLGPNSGGPGTAAHPDCSVSSRGRREVADTRQIWRSLKRFKAKVDSRQGNSRRAHRYSATVTGPISRSTGRSPGSG